MKKTIEICDVCKEENDTKIRKLPVIVSQSQDDGAHISPFIDMVTMDVCAKCLDKVTMIEYGFREVKRMRVTKPVRKA